MMNSDDMGPIRWIRTKDDLKAFLRTVRKHADNPLVFDLETTGLDENAVEGGKTNGGVGARVSLATFTVDDGTHETVPTYVLPLSHPDSPFAKSWREALRIVAKMFVTKNVPLVGHNVRFDCRYIFGVTSEMGLPEGVPIYDDEDADLFEKGSVSNTGYWRRYYPGGPSSGYAVHDLVAERFLGPKPKGMAVDHMNRDRLDNRRCNLRYVTRSEQMRNRESWGKSGVRGAYLHKTGKYEAAVNTDGKRISLGLFETAEEAGERVREYYGDENFTPPKSLRTQPGVSLEHLIHWDTQVSSFLMDENSSTKLKERVPDVFGIERWDDFDLSKPGASEKVDLTTLGVYGAKDTYWCYRLMVEHKLHMENDEPYGAEETEDAKLGDLSKYVSTPAVASLCRIEQRGILLDVDWVTDEITKSEQRRDELTEKLATRYEDDELAKAKKPSFAPTSKWFKRWAEIAVESNHLEVIALTPKGSPQWSKAVLNKLAGRGYEVAEQLLELRYNVKRLEFLNSWLKLRAPDNTIHANYNSSTVVSGRLSSSNPNMQQVSKELRQAFIPRPGYYIADIDYSQIELRVAAFISRSQPMIRAFQDGVDLHTLFASQITEKTMDDVTPAERQHAKAGNFGLIYGMSAQGFQNYAETAYGVPLDYDDAVKTHRTFFSTWEGIQQWHDDSIAEVHKRGQVTSPVGRVRRLHEIQFADKWEAESFERVAINSPVQGMASDLMQAAIAWIQGLIPGTEPVDGAHPIGTVHDSLVTEVAADRWEEVVGECIRRMTSLNWLLEKLGCRFDVPLVAEADVGSRWGLTDIGVIE